MSGINSKLKTALDSQRYFVTISHIGNDNKLHHYWIAKDYLRNDLIPTLDHIKGEVYKKEFGSPDMRSRRSEE